MKKHILSVLVLAVLMLNLTACGDGSDTSGLTNDKDNALDLSDYIADNDLGSSNNSDIDVFDTSKSEYLNSQKVETSVVLPPTTTPKVTTKAPSTTTRATTTKKVTTAPPIITTQPSTTGAVKSDFIEEVVRLVNVERAKAGISPVVGSSSLNSAAKIRAGEIITSFSHTRPDGTSCFTVLKQLNISYSAAGENIASGQATPQQVMTGWMNSEGHRANIMNPSFGKLGVGYVTGGSYGHNWVQLFTN